MCGRACSIRHVTTDPSSDPEPLAKALAVRGAESGETIVTRTSVELVARRERARIAELFGQLNWDDGYDYKVERDRG